MLIVFARAPRPGRVKSRLVSALGAAGAARLHARLLARAVATARSARCGAVELHCAPHAGHPLFRGLARRHGIRLRKQVGGDLGARMHGALAGALEGAHARADAAVLIGSDCPALRPADLRAAFGALRAGADVVLAPAEDGGYPLIGLKRASMALFEGVPWGGPGVLAGTRARAARIGWSVSLLRTLWDVDRPGDVARLRRAKRSIRSSNLTAA